MNNFKEIKTTNSQVFIVDELLFCEKDIVDEEELKK